MTWREWTHARQLLTEERFGDVIRAIQRAEDAEFAKAARHAPKG